MLRLIIIRLVLIAIPFLVWFTWRRWALSQGREVRAWPWGWLVLAAAILLAGSIAGRSLLAPSNLGKTYVPAETQRDGSVRPGRYE